MDAKKAFLAIRELLSFSAIGLLMAFASQQFATPYFLDLRPNPWFGAFVVLIAVALAFHLGSTRSPNR